MAVFQEISEKLKCKHFYKNDEKYREASAIEDDGWTAEIAQNSLEQLCIGQSVEAHRIHRGDNKGGC